MSSTVEKCLADFLAIKGLDPDSDRYDLVYLIHQILVNAADMSPREALTLIDNAFNALIDGIAETSDGEEGE